MIDEINTTREDHILTIEDPIEFLHSHKRCLVNQRELGSDATSFADGLDARLCARTLTSSSSARCETWRRSPPR